MTGPSRSGGRPSSPRRSIVYQVWGREHLVRAMASARSAAPLGVPAVLVSDTATIRRLPAEHPFSEVVETTFSEGARMEKTRLWDHLPEGYDSFLFLDADTEILGDVGLGFEKAEIHGIAAAPAVHYSLDAFFGFEELMRFAEVVPRGQLQYNTGVLFFVRRPDVEAVFRTWHRLAVEVTRATGWKRVDQPFFTLALEKLDFNPYTLSPSFNYRALAGEPASGDIRIWHSFHPAPPDVNEYEEAWPMRRYVGTKTTRLYRVSPQRLPEIGVICSDSAPEDEVHATERRNAEHSSEASRRRS